MTDDTAVVVDIVAACLNGAAYVAEFLQSLQHQSHRRWRLWVRDDGSTDSTPAIVAEFAAADDRIQLLHAGGPPLGVAGAFGWLLDRVPSDAAYVMFADQDDVWLPAKIERTLSAMRAAEAVSPGPVLVHTDLTVVDQELREIHPSFRALSGVDPEPVTLRRLIVQNVATGAATMINKALMDRVGPMPQGAFYQDWWYACAAAVFGRIVSVRESTILYRQHGRNVVGASRAAPRWYQLSAAVRQAANNNSRLRADLRRTSIQAGAFLERFHAELSEQDRRFLSGYAGIPDRPFLRRKLDVLRLRALREHGFWRNVGLLLRA